MVFNQHKFNNNQENKIIQVQDCNLKSFTLNDIKFNYKVVMENVLFVF